MTRPDFDRSVSITLYDFRTLRGYSMEEIAEALAVDTVQAAISNAIYAIRYRKARPVRADDVEALG